MKDHSLVRRATIAVLAIELACAIGLASTAIWHERQARFRALDIALKGRSDSLVGAVQDAEDPQDNVTVNAEEFSPMPGDEFAVYNPDGRTVSTSNGDLSAVKLGQRDGFRSYRDGRQRYRVLQQHAMRIIDRFETQGLGLRRPVIVVYAVRSDRVWLEVRDATRFYVLLSLGSVALSAVLLIVLARRLLHPLKALASAASSIQPNALQFDPPVSAVATRELRPLAETLVQTTNRLRKAFEAEKRFISDAAHELKTAVAVVRSTIQVIGMKTRSEDEYRSGIERILDDHQRVEDLISRMLTLARFDEMGDAFASAIDLCDETTRVLKSFSTFAESRGVTLKCDTRSPGPKIRVAPEALETLVSNLIMNAVQHSSVGSEIRVSICEEGNRVALVVQDFGDGISEQDLPRVFERFFRADPSRSRETGGAGLGLSICKSIVQKACGSIEIESRKGSGTVVRTHFDKVQ